MPKTTKTAATLNGEPYQGVAFSVRIRDDATRRRLQVAAKRAGVTRTAWMRNAVYGALEASERSDTRKRGKS